MQADELTIQLLQEEWMLLEASLSTLLLSVGKCRKIGVKACYSFEEEESFDSLTSKFNRTSDLFTQKIIRTVWALLHESFAPFLDMVNKCEKTGIVRYADEIISIRDVRNQIAHEYIPAAIHKLIPEVLTLCDILVQNIHFCRHFLISRKWIQA